MWNGHEHHEYFIDPECAECGCDLKGKNLAESGDENVLLFCILCHANYCTEWIDKANKPD
jgi:hypothetical protein